MHTYIYMHTHLFTKQFQSPMNMRASSLSDVCKERPHTGDLLNISNSPRHSILSVAIHNPEDHILRSTPTEANPEEHTR